MSGRRGLAIAAAAALAALSACAGTERALFVTLTGEAPGANPLYAGLSASVKLGQEPPRVPTGNFAMAPLPQPTSTPPPAIVAALGPVQAAAERARQSLVDREHEFDIRRRYLRLATEDYAKAVLPLIPKVGEALPANTPSYQADMAALKRLLGRIQADVVALHGIMLRQDQARDVAERVRAVAKEMAARPGLAAEAKKPLDEIDAALEKNLAAAGEMLKAGETLVAAFVEWLAAQRAAAEALEAEVAEGGSAPADRATSFFSRKSLFESSRKP